MNPKRVAGVINLILAGVALYMGLSSHPVRIFYLVIAGVLLLLAYLRLKRPPGGTPPLT